MQIYFENDRTCYYKDVTSIVKSFSGRDEIFSDDKIRKRLVSSIAEEHGGNPIKCLTLDVFDTVVLRNEKSEARRFWEIAGVISRQLSSSKKDCERLQKDVFVSRVLSTHASYRVRRPKNDCREGSLRDIYFGICGALGLGRGAARDLMRLEIQYEIENTRPNPLMWDVLEFAESIGAQVAMISDMYMHSEEIKEIVKGHFPNDIDRFGDLYSSADEIVSKRSGFLFDVVREATGFEAFEYFHIGDSVVGDFRMPKVKGWRSMLIPLTFQEVDAIRADHDNFIEYMRRVGVDMEDLVKSGV